MRFRTGTGMSGANDPVEAGKEAANAAVAQLAGEKPVLVMVYASIGYDLPALLASIRSVTGEAELVGATTAGHFANGRVQPIGPCGVAVLALSGDRYRFGIASAEHISSDLVGAGRRLARESQAAAGQSPYGAVLLLTDWLIGDQQRLIQGIYRVTGPRIPVVGGAAADMLTMGPTLVFHNDQVLEQGAVAVWIASERPLKVVTKHGWEPLGMPMLVGRVEGISLQELNGGSAADIYADVLELPREAVGAQDTFYPIGLRHPLAIVQPDGSLLVRAVIGRTPDGGLLTTSEVPAGCAVHVTKGSAESLLSCIEPLAEQVLDEREDAGVLLAFSCIARAQVMGERCTEEATRLQKAVGDVATFGFWTYGEYGRTVGVLGTHNATLTALAL
jgi:hypothetical protein